VVVTGDAATLRRPGLDSREVDRYGRTEPAAVQHFRVIRAFRPAPVVVCRHAGVDATAHTMSTVAIPPGQLERLWCETGGHHFERPLVRGVKPVACPEHRREYVRLEQRRRRGTPDPSPEPVAAIGNGHLKVIYGHVADCSIRGDDLPARAAALRRLAAAAEMLALDLERSVRR
jgi:hypothetical protein